jgi:hypothetical protein
MGKEINIHKLKKGEIETEIATIDQKLKESNTSVQKMIDNFLRETILNHTARDRAERSVVGILKSVPPEVLSELLADPGKLERLVENTIIASKTSKADIVQAFRSDPGDQNSLGNLYETPPGFFQDHKPALQGLSHFERILSDSQNIGSATHIEFRNTINEFLQEIVKQNEMDKIPDNALDFTAMLLAKIKEKHADEAKNIHIPKLSIPGGKEGNSRLKERITYHRENPINSPLDESGNDLFPSGEKIKETGKEVEDSPLGEFFQEIDALESGNE